VLRPFREILIGHQQHIIGHQQCFGLPPSNKPLQHAEMRKNAPKCASRNAPARGDAQKRPKMRI